MLRWPMIRFFRCEALKSVKSDQTGGIWELPESETPAGSPKSVISATHWGRHLHFQFVGYRRYVYISGLYMESDWIIDNGGGFCCNIKINRTDLSFVANFLADISIQYVCWAMLAFMPNFPKGIACDGTSAPACVHTMVCFPAISTKVSWGSVIKIVIKMLDFPARWWLVWALGYFLWSLRFIFVISSLPVRISRWTAVPGFWRLLITFVGVHLVALTGTSEAFMVVQATTTRGEGRWLSGSSMWPVTHWGTRWLMAGDQRGGAMCPMSSHGLVVHWSVIRSWLFVCLSLFVDGKIFQM